MPTETAEKIDAAFDQLLELKKYGQSKEADKQDELFNYIGRVVIKDLHRIANALEVLSGKEDKETTETEESCAAA